MFEKLTIREGAFEIEHWVDLPNAQGWFDVANQLFQRTRDLDGNNQNYMVQKEGVVAAWQALANAYRSLNLNPWTDPVYAAALKKWAGNIWRRDKKLFRFFGPDVENDTTGGIFEERFRYAWIRVGGATFNQQNVYCGGFMRLMLSETGEVIANCLGSNTAPPPEGCGPSGPWAGCAYVSQESLDSYGKPIPGPILPGCAVYNWRILAWNASPNLVLPPEFYASGTNAACGVAGVLYPLEWFYEMGAEIAKSAADRGARAVLLDGRMNIMRNNLNAMIEAGIITEPELLRLNEEMRNRPVVLSGETEKFQEIAAYMQFAISILYTVGGYAAAIGAVLQVALLIASVLPAAEAEVYPPRFWFNAIDATGLDGKPRMVVPRFPGAPPEPAPTTTTTPGTTTPGTTTPPGTTTTGGAYRPVNIPNFSNIARNLQLNTTQFQAILGDLQRQAEETASPAVGQSILPPAPQKAVVTVAPVAGATLGALAIIAIAMK